MRKLSKGSRKVSQPKQFGEKVQEKPLAPGFEKAPGRTRDQEEEVDFVTLGYFHSFEETDTRHAYAQAHHHQANGRAEVAGSQL